MLVAFVTTAVVVAGAVAAGDGLRRATDPRPGQWAGGLLVATVWGTASLLGASALLGLVGRFDRPALTAAMVLVGTVAQWVGRTRPAATVPQLDLPDGELGEQAMASDAPPADGARPSALVVGVAVFAVVAVGVLWAGSTVETLRRGILDNDAQHYHLTHAARYAQTGEVFDVHFVSAGDLSAYHPSNDELLRAAGMVTSRTELPGLAVNWVAAGTVLLAAAVAGRRLRRTAALLLLAVAVLAEPNLGPLYGGSAANDHLAIGMLAGGLALAMTTRRPGGIVTAGVAIGIAMGTKLTVLVPGAAVLLAHPFVRPRATRWRDGALLLGPAVLIGSWWYIRNWVASGNPVPGMDLPLGPLSLPEPPAPFTDLLSASVLSYLDDPSVVVDWFVPGFADALGWLWPLHLLLVPVAVVVGIRRGRRAPWFALLATVSAIAGLAYLATPTGAAGLDGSPYLFALNVRYLLPALALAGWVVAGWLSHRAALLVGAALAASTLVPALADARTSPPLALAGGAVAVVLGVLAARWASDRRDTSARLSDVGALVPRWVVPVTVGAGVLAVAVLGGPLRGPYLAGRYDMGPTRVEMFRAVDGQSGLRVGVVGLPRLYGYTGQLLVNEVEYVGYETPDHGFLNHETCEALFGALAQGGYDVLAVAEADGRVTPPVTTWLEQAEGVVAEVRVQEGSVWRIDRAPDPEACP